jgi:hypothetical protein
MYHRAWRASSQRVLWLLIYDGVRGSYKEDPSRASTGHLIDELVMSAACHRRGP